MGQLSLTEGGTAAAAKAAEQPRLRLRHFYGYPAVTLGIYILFTGRRPHSADNLHWCAAVISAVEQNAANLGAGDR